jgi:hypothetical protein
LIVVVDRSYTSSNLDCCIGRIAQVNKKDLVAFDSIIAEHCYVDGLGCLPWRKV